MGWATTTKMRFFLIWLRVKKNNLINSKAFIFLLGLIIGASFLYTYTEGIKLVDYIRTGYAYAYHTNASPAPASDDAVNDLDKSDGEVDLVASPYDTLLKKYFGDEAKLAYAVMMGESTGDPARIGDTHMAKYSYGLFQINQTWHNFPKEQLLDAEFNIKTAKEIRDSYGWEQWSAYKNGSYKKFL